MREIKFRAWDIYKEKMFGEFVLKDICKQDGFFVDILKFMQHTGLKDKNGKEIYEGDIIAIDGGAEPYKTKVFFKNGCFCVDMEGNDAELKYYIDMNFCEAEIIGNIYENPDLLESK